jgi:hypothetical protein
VIFFLVQKKQEAGNDGKEKEKCLKVVAAAGASEWRDGPRLERQTANTYSYYGVLRTLLRTPYYLAVPCPYFRIVVIVTEDSTIRYLYKYGVLVPTAPVTTMEVRCTESLLPYGVPELFTITPYSVLLPPYLLRTETAKERKEECSEMRLAMAWLPNVEGKGLAMVHDPLFAPSFSRPALPPPSVTALSANERLPCTCTCPFNPLRKLKVDHLGISHRLVPFPPVLGVIIKLYNHSLPPSRLCICLRLRLRHTSLS